MPCATSGLPGAFRVVHPHEQRGGVGPGRGPGPLVQHLVALEAQPRVAALQHHLVGHGPGFHALRVGRQEVEHAARDRHRLVPQRRAGDGAGDGGGVGRVRDHPVQVVGMDGQLEAHRLVARAAPGAGDLVVVGDAACRVGARDHRVGADPALHRLGELEARAEQRRVLLDQQLDRVLRQLDGARFEMAGRVLEQRFGVVRDRRDLARHPLQQARRRRGGRCCGGMRMRCRPPARPGAAAGRGRSPSPARRTASWQVRSASALMVRSGFTPAAPGSTAPSQTYRPSCTASPSLPENTWPWWLTTPSPALSPMPQPPSGCTVISLRPSDSADSGFGMNCALDRVVGGPQPRVVLGDRGAGAGLRPVDAQPVFLEVQAAGRLVHAHHQVGLRAGHRAGVGQAGQAAGIALHRLAQRLRIEQAGLGLRGAVGELAAQHRVGEEQGRRQHRGQGAGDDALLDHQPVAHLGRLAHVDHAGDARPRQIGRRDLVAPRAHAVDVALDRLALRVGAGLPVAVVAQREHVAVAGEALAEAVRQRQALRLGAQQDLGRAQGAGAEHHHVGRDAAPAGGPLRGRAFGAPQGDLVEEHAPARAVALDVADPRAREDLRAVAMRVGQVVHARGVLRAHVAAAGAIAAQVAARLRHAEGVHLVDEVHRDRRALEGLLHRRGRFLQRQQLVQRREVFRILGIGRRVEHLPGPCDVGVEQLRVAAELGRPGRGVEQARVDLQRDVGIDQRGAAQAAAHHRQHVVVQVQVVQAVGRAELAARTVDLHVGLRGGEVVRELAGQDLAAALQHADRLAGPREARSRHAGAIAGTDHDHRVVRGDLAERAGDGLHRHACAFAVVLARAASRPVRPQSPRPRR